MDIGQPKIAATETIGQLFVIHSQKVEDRCPQIINRGDILHRVVAQFIGGTINRAASDPSTRQPDAKAKRIVIAPVVGLGKGRATKFSGPDDECFVEKATRLEVVDEASDRLIYLEGHFRVTRLQYAVLIPWVAYLAGITGSRQTG